MSKYLEGVKKLPEQPKVGDALVAAKKKKELSRLRMELMASIDRRMLAKAEFDEARREYTKASNALERFKYGNKGDNK